LTLSQTLSLTIFLLVTAHYHDPDANEWVEVASIPGAPRVAGSEFTYKGYGCIISGEGAPDGSGNLAYWPNSVVQATDGQEAVEHRSLPTAEFFCYSPDYDKWVELPPAPGRSRWVPTTFIRDDYLYYLQGPIRQGQDATFQQDWPAQGYRINMLEVDKYMQEQLNGTDSGSSAWKRTASPAALAVLIVSLFVGRY
jgi:hypothetical protein